MKYAFVTILSLMSIILVIFIALFSKRKNEMKRYMYPCFIEALIVMIANIFMTLTKNTTISMIAHSTFFMSMGFLCLSFMIFCIKYTTGKVGKLSYVFMVIELFDLLNLFINQFTNHAFTIVEKGEFLTFLMTNPSIIYSSHLIICYIELGLGFTYLLISTFNAASIYKIKYIYIVFTFIIGIILDCLYLYFNSILNWSVVVFPIICIGSYYFIDIYIPHKLNIKTLSFVTETIENGIIAFDKDNNVVYTNAFFKNFFNISEVNKSSSIITEWTKDRNLEEMNEYEEIITTDTQTYKLQFHRFETKKKVYLGSFFTIIDLTKEMEQIHQEHIKNTRDSLTGVYNRDYFYHKADKLISDNPDIEYTIVISDICNFKMINESLGSEKADEILRQFGTFLKKYALPDDRYGRLEADRFAMILPKKRFNEEQLIKLSNQIMDSVNKHLSRFFNCQLGIYDLNEKISVRRMCDRAILALKNIKGTTQRVSYYEKDSRENILLEHRLTGELKDAIKKEQIKVFIQPQTDEQGKILGGECLVRWKHPELGLISPATFIPMFEKNGSITDVDLFIWEKACKILKSWKDTQLKDLYLSVNISAKDLINIDIPQTFKKLADKYEIDHKLLKLEITESTAVNSVLETEEVIRQLHDEGFIVEMDDFGAGYSSLNTLKDLSIDTIKLDMVFLRDSEHILKSRKIIKAITTLAKELDIEVIVEGVETSEHVEFLKSVGGSIFQGYYFYKPMPWTDYEKIANEQIG